MKVKDFLISILITILSVIVVWYFSGGTPMDEKDIPETEEMVVAPPVINYEYERIMVDSLFQEGGFIRRNQPLSTLLAQYGITPKQVHELSEKSRSIFDLRKIRYGHPYKMYFTPDSLKKLEYFVYEHTPLEYLAVQFTDSIDLWTGVKAVDTISSYFVGSIETSLWNLMIEKGANPMLAFELSEIYAWSIDFFGLQEGDSIRVIYDEYFVDSIPIGIGFIHGAYFNHMDSDFWAIPFVQDSVMDYYDEEGQSLRKAFLKAPLRFSRISSRFSHSRLHPVLKIRRPHHGVDYAAPVGTPVVAIGDGVVVKRGYNGGAGHMVRIKHNSVYSTAYLHLSRYGKGIVNGAYVKQGDVIGYVGSTGLSTGPHLDFRFYKNNSPVDPLKVEAPPVDPLREENLTRYDSVKVKVMNS
ncbi:MAG: M23 family metallopeptidase, partial [Bacteroidales bacterium]